MTPNFLVNNSNLPRTPSPICQQDPPPPDTIRDLLFLHPVPLNSPYLHPLLEPLHKSKLLLHRFCDPSTISTPLLEAPSIPMIMSKLLRPWFLLFYDSCRCLITALCDQDWVSSTSPETHKHMWRVVHLVGQSVFELVHLVRQGPLDDGRGAHFAIHKLLQVVTGCRYGSVTDDLDSDGRDGHDEQVLVDFGFEEWLVSVRELGIVVGVLQAALTLLKKLKMRVNYERRWGTGRRIVVAEKPDRAGW